MVCVCGGGYLWKQIAGLPLRVSELAGLGWGLRTCISHKSPADTDGLRDDTLKSADLEDDNVHFTSGW